MKKHFSRHPIKVFTLKKALEERFSNENLSIGSNNTMTYRMLLADGVKWEFASILSGIGVFGGSYYVLTKQLKKIRILSRWTVRFMKFNPAIFIIGTAAALGTSESAIYAMDFVYQKHLQGNIERSVQHLNGQHNEMEKTGILRNIVDNAINLVAIKERDFFIDVMNVQYVESISDAREFFGNLVKAYPELLDTEIEKDEIASLLEKLESVGVTGMEKELEPLRKYLVLKNSIRKLSRWYMVPENAF